MFENVPPGNYHVGVRAEGYSTRRTEVTVGSTPATLDIAVDFDLHFAEVVSVSPNARPQFESYQPTSVLVGRSSPSSSKPPSAPRCRRRQASRCVRSAPARRGR